MKVLLDTHALLWWWAADPRMGVAALRTVADETNEIFVSAASIWEIASKHRMGKLPEAGRLMPGLDHHIRRSRFTELPVTFAHAELAGTFRGDIRDPFDRMLIAQGTLEAMPIVSSDRVFAAYGLKLIWDGLGQ